MTQSIRQTNYRSACLILATIFALIGSHTANAGTVVWANNASLGGPHIQAYDLDTGQNVADFAAPNPDAGKGQANGRGIAVVGQTIYYTLANSGKVYMTDTNSHVDLGIAFSTPLAGIGAISWDGSGLWVTPYVGLGFFNAHSDNAYKYSPNGALLRTVALTPPGFNSFAGNTEPRNGLTVTPTGFVTDRGASVPYDAYDLNGTLTRPFLITSQLRTSGITFDGTNYIVSDVVNRALSVYDGNGLFIKGVPLSGAVIPFGLEGLSAVVTSTLPVTVAPPPVTVAPPPVTVAPPPVVVAPPPVVVAPPPVAVGLPAVTAVLLNPTSVVGGAAPLTGTVILASPAPAGGATIVLTADNPGVAFPGVSTVTIPAGASSATFPVTTGVVTSVSFSVISANFNSTGVSASLTVLAPYSLASLTLSPLSVLAGLPVQGTITLTNPADAGAVVTLASSDPAALTVPQTVVVPPGASSVTFSASSLPAGGTVLVTATLKTGVQTASVQIIAPAAAADNVTIKKAELVLKTKIMKVEAMSTSSAASLQVTVDVLGTNLPIADLIHAGGGKYIGQFAVALNYQNIKVKSSLGGLAVTTVALK